MSRNNTGNPIGSKAFPDFEDNVKNLDEAVNTADPQWVDRFGRFRLPLMEQERQFVSDQERREGEFQADQSSREAVFSDFLQASGYQDLGEYAPGIEITAHNQYVNFGGQPYTLKPSIPVPYTTSGGWTGADFKLIGDDSLRQDLANPGMGAAMVARGVVAVDSIADLLALPEGQLKDALLYSVSGYYGAANYLTAPYLGGADFKWVPESEAIENFGTVHAIPEREGPGRFHMVIHANTTDTRQWGLPGDLTPPERARRLQSMWDWCAGNDVKAVVCPDTFVLDRYVGRPTPSAALLVPANLNIHFEPGCLITKVPFREEQVEGFYRILTLSDESNNIVGTGVVEIDGQGDTVTWYNEHNHCIFFYACSDVDFGGLSIVSYNAMGDCVSLSGGNNRDSLTKRVRIGSIICTKLNGLGRTARRKSLVVEACSDCWIGSAVLDNGAANCLDYEPFNIFDDGDMLSLKIDYLKCFSGTDYTAGTGSNRTRLAKLYIDTFIIMVPDRAPELQPKSNLILSYGVDCIVNSLHIDYTNSSSATLRGMNLQFDACRWTVGDLSISVSDKVHGEPAVTVIAASAGGNSGPAELNAQVIKIKGRGNKSIEAKGVINADIITIEGVLEEGVKADLGDSRIFGQWNQNLSHYFNVNKVLFRNVRLPSGALITPSGSGGIIPIIWRIGNLTLLDEATSDPVNAAVWAQAAQYQQHVIIESITLHGQRPTSLSVSSPAGSPFWITRGGFGTPSEYMRLSTTPHIIPAVAGSTCRCTNGTFWIKTVDADEAGDQTAGWVNMVPPATVAAVVEAPNPTE